jgi:hypothetical protein
VFTWFCYSGDKLLHIGDKCSAEDAEENAIKFINNFLEESASDDYYV